MGRPQRPVRKRTADELMDDLERASRILHEGTQRFDGGDDLGLDLIAGRLRLLACRGRGNELVKRVANRLGQPVPVVGFEAPVPDDPTLTFAVAALPAQQIGGGSRRASLEVFMNQRCLTVTDDAGQQTFTWDELVSDAANKLLLVHSDDDIPAVLDEVALYEVAGVRGIPFMMRAASVVVLEAANAVLTGAGRSPPSPPIRSVRGIWTGTVLVRGGRP